MVDAPEPTTGLSQTPRDEWPKPIDPSKQVFEYLSPGSDPHQKVLDYLIERIDDSERSMQSFYSRWASMEKKVQAYVTLPDYEKLLEGMNKQGKPPQVVSIVVPYGFAVISTIVTYLLHTFCGRKPILQVGCYKGAKVKAAENMEQVLQYQADHTRLVKHIWQFLQDTQVYGVGILRAQWKKEMGWRTKPIAIPRYNIFAQLSGQTTQLQRAQTLIYAGNEVEVIDPFMFFPDPRVPMNQVNKKGEFVFWRAYVGKHKLKGDPTYHWVDNIPHQLPINKYTADSAAESARGLKSQGESFPGRNNANLLRNYVQIDEGTIDLIPKELGLGNGEVPEKWLFTIANKKIIIRAEKFDTDHGLHPVCVSEPYQLGHGFGNLGMSDYISPLQDLISWLVNSHMKNVRSALNNMFVVDPSMVEMQDLKNTEDGKLIRLKRAAYGMDVRMAVNQLQVADVTGGHLKDTEVMVRFGQIMSGVVDNLLGLQDAGGRKTATEVRTAGEAGASRLAATGRVISSQAMVDLSFMMTLNTQQYMEQAIELSVMGPQGMMDSVKLGPEEIGGDFYFPVNDGTLPLDKVAMLDVWKEILMGVAKDQELRMNFSLPKIFQFVAELGGAKNIEQFKVQLQPNQVVANGAAQGNLVPLPAQLTGPPMAA